MHALSAPPPRRSPRDLGKLLTTTSAPQGYHCLDHLLKGPPDCRFVRCTNMNVRRA
jgi:hypothetical protein